MSNQKAGLHKKWASGILYRGLILLIITPILKSLVVPVIWLALIGVFHSQIAPFFALTCIFFPANEETTLKTKTTSQISRLVKSNQSNYRKMKDKEYHVQLLFPKLLLFFPPKMDEFNFKLA